MWFVPLCFFVTQSLLPSGKQKSITKPSSGQRKVQKKFTTKDSQDGFIVTCDTEALYKEHYNLKVAQQSSMPPYITIIGSLLEPIDIFCDFENISYKMYSLSKAIYVCFKAYHLFDIEYPPAARLIWQFINQQFYQIPDSSTYPSVYVLTKTIQGNKNKTLLKFFNCIYMLLCFFCRC